MIGDIIFIALGGGILYLLNLARGLYPGDAGDLVSAAYTGGVAHPPGFPLYTVFGWLVTRLPWLTPAWRMAWVSLVPHIIVLTFVYSIVYRLTKHRAVSFFATLVLAGNYLFFLYSVTPEVFALLDLFVILLMYLALRLHQKFELPTFLVFCFVTGLSLTHHPLIVLLYPSLLLLIVPPVRAKMRWTWKTIVAVAGAFFVGLLPYAYIPIAANGNSIINWDRPNTVSGFMRLILRQDYGSFMSGSIVGHALIERLISVKIYFVFLIIDFTWIGILLAVLGFVWLWMHHKAVFWSFTIAILLFGPGFSFYASFPTVNRFVLGTVERFSLPSYVEISVVVGIGVFALMQWAALGSRFILKETIKRKQFAALIVATLFMYPIVVGCMNAWRFAGIATDLTTDHYAQDLLDSAPTDAIVFLTRDTPIFGVQYVRYAKLYRADTIVIHGSLIESVFYHQILVRVFGHALKTPIGNVAPKDYLTEFMKVNYPLRPILSNTPFTIPNDWVWEPHGLLLQLKRKSDILTTDDLVAINKRLWQSYHDPTKGLLSRYRHLFLTSVLDEYAIAGTTYGKFLLGQQRLGDAKSTFQRSVYYGSDTQTSTAYMYLGLTESLQKDCVSALSSYDKAKDPTLPLNPALLYFEAVTYRDCVGDERRADQLFSQYEATNHQSEQPLEGPPKTL